MIVMNGLPPENCFAEAVGDDARGQAESDSNQSQNSRIDEPKADDKGEIMLYSVELNAH